MTKVNRFSMALLIALALVASFGCSEKATQPEAQPAVTAEQPSAPNRADILEEAGVTIETSRIFFAFDRYDLNDHARNALRVKADILMKFPEISVKIEGHTDERGTEEYNLALGERRARAAFDYLVMLGVNPAQLSMVSYGELYPAVEGSNEEAWSQNRRDEFRPTISY